MIKKLIHLLTHGHYKAEELKKVEPSIFTSNRNSLFIFGALSCCATFAGSLGGLLTDVEVMKRSLIGYIVVFCLNLLAIVLNYLVKKPSRAKQSAIISLYVIPLYLFALFQAIFISPNDRPLILVVFLCLIPTIFIDAPIRLYLDFIGTTIIYAVVAPQIVPPQQIGINIADIVIFGIAGIGIGLFFNKSRTERFVLAMRIEEMRSESEQMKYWKSISDIYLSMEQIDLVNDTYLEIKTNKIANVAHEKNTSYSKVVADIMKETTDPDYVEAVLQFVDPKTLQERLGDEKTITYEFLDKNYGWCRARYIAVNQKKGEALTQAMFLVESINEQKKREKLLTTIAETDGMTGLLNRRAGIPKIKKQLGLGNQGMLCLLDVDKFKHINDNYGHQAGDRVIVAVADVLRETFRDVDIILRLGGDEFLFFVSNVESEQIGCNIFNRLFKNFEKVVISSIPDYKISVSIGATFYKEGRSFDELYSQADCGTYESKKVNGKAFTFFRG